MNDVPRIHHFVPQFWIKKFTASDGKLWTYDWKDDRIRERSSKQLMQVFNLYTIQPSGIDDASLEVIDNNKIDNDGAEVFRRILSGEHSDDAKKALSSFLAAQVVRDPEVVLSYNPGAQELTLSLLEIFDEDDYSTFCSRWNELYHDTYVTETEFNYIRSLGLSGAENELEKIIAALDSTEGLPDLPFTDLVRSPEGRKKINDRLLTCDWTLKTVESDGFILGDTGVLYDRGSMVALRVPLSPKTALYLTPTDKPNSGIRTEAAREDEVFALNIESASRSRRWLVGEPDILEEMKSQVRSNSFLS
jgi:hypothetical protein